MPVEGPVTVLGGGVRSVLHRATATRPRRWILAVTVLIGLAVPVLLAVAGDADDRAFAAMCTATLSLMSLPLPFLGALLAGDVRRSRAAAAGERDPERVRSAESVRVSVLLWGVSLLALAEGAIGAVASAVAVAVSADESTDAWRGAATIVAGCLLVALVAQLVGTGFGLLVRNPVLACAATVVVPLGLWLLLGVFLKPAQWLTPFPNVQHLLSGDMTGLAWLQWLVMAVLWGGGLNALGAVQRRARGGSGGNARSDR